MSSLLRPVVLEPCHGGLRERRRSTVNPLCTLPPVFTTGPTAAQEGSAILDDNEVEVSGTVPSTVNSSSTFIKPNLAALANVQLPDRASNIVLARHCNSSPTAYADDACSPLSSLPTTPASRKPSIITLTDGVDPDYVKQERLKWRLASGFFAYFMCGWGDGVTGTILPYFMADYHVSFMMSSLLFAGSTIGFMIGTFLVESIIHQLGRFDPAKSHWSWLPKTNLFSRFSTRSREEKDVGYSSSQARLLALLSSSILHGMFFVMMGSRGGYWVSFGAYSVAAFARSILTASLNAYFASGPGQSLGFAFGLWSFGAVASPLVCQTIVASGVPWSKFYYGSLVLSVVNTTFLALTFKPTATEFIRDRQGATLMVSNDGREKWSDEASSPTDVEHKSPTSKTCNLARNEKTLRTALTLPYQWAICIFIILYCGCETTTQGFMVSYLRGTRHVNDDTVGYVTSGFWGGITIGRLAWGHFTPKYVLALSTVNRQPLSRVARLSYSQRKLVIQGCMLRFHGVTSLKFLSWRTVIGLTMQILIWRVNSNLENSVSTAIIGLVYGPVFPACLTLANDILPSEVRMVSMALISATGSLGAALFPFIAGTISSTEGVQTLVYVTVPLAGTIMCLWALFPSKIPARSQIV
ncbi:hypothetical protein GALMADRAFT_131573 [Galerina marginata CBS 339.88]|uniref:Major facilitator superfamily (MFS) profile domain-containing protein n=1 Tax=Galerina marginata (strain CBS 339.88) TaxID=685588 RepID=A0A067U0C0_GALM3|nr:hypothetical protein GALMADRAFT_131573 [Galerina marginata CBS 339.88]